MVINQILTITVDTTDNCTLAKKGAETCTKMRINQCYLGRNIISECPSFETPIKIHRVCKFESTLKRDIPKR